MRAVSLVNKLEFEVPGGLMKDALALGDVDNDKGNELAIGNIHGDLFVFKGSYQKPWRTATDLGMITSVLVGNVMNEGKNHLVSLSGEGWCNIFSISCAEVKFASQDDSSPPEDRRRLHPVHTQRLPANGKIALLADIDNDGNIELIIGLTDRVVRSYRWITHADKESGMLVAQNKWEFASQIGSVCPHTFADGNPCLLVSQPGGTYVRLLCSTTSTETVSLDHNRENASVPSLEYHPLSSTKLRNPNITTEIIGNIQHGKEDKPSPYFAVTTLDGTLLLVDNEQIMWSLKVDHQLFALTKLDVTGDGRDEIIVTSWEGETYIINQERESIRFHLEDSVCTFAAGSYGLQSNHNTPCLVYATFNNRVCLFYDIQISHIATANLIDTMTSRPKTEELLNKLEVDHQDVSKLQELYSWCLYGERAVEDDT